MISQKILHKIVSSWNKKNIPEYRGFLCGACGKKLHKAWFHYIISHEYKTPVHLCNTCEKKFERGTLEVAVIPTELVSESQAKYQEIPDQARLASLSKRVRNDIVKWWKSAKGIYKTFFCDMCGKNLFKAYHVWARDKKTLIETHFCKTCFLRV